MISVGKISINLQQANAARILRYLMSHYILF